MMAQSNNIFRFDGMDELEEDLRELPFRLRNEATAIVHRNAQAAFNDIYASYPESNRKKSRGRSGDLKRGLTLEYDTGSTEFGAGAIIRNKAKHAYLFEHGSARGQRPGNVFIPAMIRHRRTLREDLWNLLERNGLLVSDDGQ